MDIPRSAEKEFWPKLKKKGVFELACYEIKWEHALNFSAF
jgi:hypothetical protein